MFLFLWVVSKEGVLVKTPIIQLLDTCQNWLSLELPQEPAQKPSFLLRIYLNE